MNAARALVCGGRTYGDRARVWAVLDTLRPSCVIHGDARGADRLADEWAKTCGIPAYVFPADWERHGRMAGPIRNARMLRDGKPTVVIAFPGGRGTANMISQARLAGVKVIQINKNTET